MPAKKNGSSTPTQVKAEAKALREAALDKQKAAEALAAANLAVRDAELDEDDEAPDLTEFVIPAAEPSKLESILAEIGSEGTFQVFFQQPNGEDLKLGQYDIQDYPQKLEILARRKGGGTFKVVFRNSSGHYKASTTRTYDPDTYGGAKPEVVAPTAGMDTTAMLTLMMDMNRQAAERSDKMMMHFMEMQSKNSASAQPFGGLSLKDLKEVLGGESKKSFAEEARVMIETLALLRDDGGLEPENPWVSALSRGMVMLQPFLEAGAKRLANPNALPAAPGLAEPGVVGHPPGAQGSGTPLLAQSQTPGVDPSIDPGETVAPVSVLPPAPIPAEVEASTYGGYGTMLLAAANAQSEPGASARFVLDNCAMQLEAENLRIVATDPHVVARVIQHTPQIKPHTEWLTEFFNEIRAGINELMQSFNPPPPPPVVAPVVAPVVVAPTPEPVIVDSEVVDPIKEKEPVGSGNA